MKPLAALVAIAVLLLTGMIGTASAQAPAPAPALTLTLDDVGPRVVTADGPGSLTVSGTLRNTGTVPVTDLVIRLQRGEPLDTEGEVRDALDGSAGTDAVTPTFTPLAGALDPGQQVPVQLSVLLRGSATAGLALSTAGTYELLVNVNGSPAGAARARLAAVRMLLPVLSLPATGDFRAIPAAAVAEPSPFTLLYPISEVPRRVATVPGAPALLSDDMLAASFAPTGRLGGLLAALAQQAPPGSAVRAATCLAVDPDLVETASVMSQQAGYQVAAPDGSTRAGTGAAVAGQWLAQLRSAARGGCVIALPYADADLVALTRGGLGSDAARALASGRQVLTDLLQTTVSPLAWPADGLLDEPTAQVVSGTGTFAVALSSDGTGARGRPGTGAVAVAGAALTAVLTDPLLTRAAAGPDGTAAEPAPGRGAAVAADTPAGTDGPLSTQDAIGALAFRSGTGRPLVLAPPHRWAADATGASALLSAVDTLVDTGRFTPRSLADAAASPTGAAAVALSYPLSAGAAEVPPAAVATIGRAAHDLADLRTAVVADSGVGISADQLFAPLEAGLLRPASATRRGDTAAAQAAADSALTTVGNIRGAVRVLEPASPYSLGTSDAPLPLTVANGLPVTVRVRVEIASTAGLRVAPLDAQQIPPLGRRQVSVNAKVTRSGQFVVDAAVRTPEGGLLGPPSRLRVRSTAYGTITGWLTAIAGGILVLLVARRIRRRVLTSRPTDRVDPASPAPGPADVGPADPTVLLPAVDPVPPPAPMIPAPEDLTVPVPPIADEVTERFPAQHPPTAR